MAGKTESPKQRLERIAAQVLAGLTANAHPTACFMAADDAAALAITRAKELINQLDAIAEAE